MCKQNPIFRDIALQRSTMGVMYAQIFKPIGIFDIILHVSSLKLHYVLVVDIAYSKPTMAAETKKYSLACSVSNNLSGELDIGRVVRRKISAHCTTSLPILKPRQESLAFTRQRKRYDTAHTDSALPYHEFGAFSEDRRIKSVNIRYRGIAL